MYIYICHKTYKLSLLVQMAGLMTCQISYQISQRRLHQPNHKKVRPLVSHNPNHFWHLDFLEGRTCEYLPQTLTLPIRSRSGMAGQFSRDRQLW